MSKMDALRAMREAKYEQAQARAATRPAAPTGGEPVPRRAATTSSPPVVASPQPGAEACGHRSMNGRTCTREPGHAAKSHRYS